MVIIKKQGQACTKVKWYLQISICRKVISLAKVLLFSFFLDDQLKEDENCPLPPMDGYPDCRGKLKVTHFFITVIAIIELSLVKIPQNILSLTQSYCHY